jgi:hypothetical protein
MNLALRYTQSAKRSSPIITPRSIQAPKADQSISGSGPDEIRLTANISPSAKHVPFNEPKQKEIRRCQVRWVRRLVSPLEPVALEIFIRRFCFDKVPRDLIN